MEYNIKPCHAHLYEGLDSTQMKYAMDYGRDKDDLKYKSFKIQYDPNFRFSGGWSPGMPVTKVVRACCKEHAFSFAEGVWWAKEV